MATSALIMVKHTLPSGKQGVESIYCHFDGGPGELGKTLKDHYSDYRTANDLIGLGDIRYLLPTLDEMENDTRVLYHQPAKVYASEAAAYKANSLLNYFYVLKDDGWYCRQHGRRVWHKL